MGEFKKGREEMENELEQMKDETLGTGEEESTADTEATQSSDAEETTQTRDTA
jgi:Sec-independent protein translocase protein TatA